MSSCHGLEPCEKYACKVEMLIKCPCGRREAFVECLAKKKRLKHVLKCNEVCENFKRFKGIYQREGGKETYYPALLVNYVRTNLKFIKKLEKNI